MKIGLNIVFYVFVSRFIGLSNSHRAWLQSVGFSYRVTPSSGPADQSNQRILLCGLWHLDAFVGSLTYFLIFLLANSISSACAGRSNCVPSINFHLFEQQWARVGGPLIVLSA